MVAPFFGTVGVLFAFLTGFLANDITGRNRQAARAVNSEAATSVRVPDGIDCRHRRLSAGGSQIVPSRTRSTNPEIPDGLTARAKSVTSLAGRLRCQTS
ncbi:MULTISPECIES: bestrophin-like domain [unclassified Bradyrhizobium]